MSMEDIMLSEINQTQFSLISKPRLYLARGHCYVPQVPNWSLWDWKSILETLFIAAIHTVWAVKAHPSTVAEITNNPGFSNKLAQCTLQTLVRMLHFVLFCFQVLWIPGDHPGNLLNKQLILKLHLNLVIWVLQPSGIVTPGFNVWLRWLTLSSHSWWQVESFPQ